MKEKNIIDIIVGFFIGLVAAFGALVISIFSLAINHYCYVIEYPGTTVVMDKKQKIERIRFTIDEKHAGGHHLPLFVRYDGSVLKLDASTTVEEISAFVKASGCRYSIRRSMELGDRRGGRDFQYDFDLGALDFYSANGRTLCGITIRNHSQMPPFEIASADGSPFVFPLTREKVERLLGKARDIRRSYPK